MSASKESSRVTSSTAPVSVPSPLAIARGPSSSSSSSSVSASFLQTRHGSNAPVAPATDIAAVSVFSQKKEEPSIRKQIWRGCIPVRFIMSQDEVREFGATAEYYILVPRVAYLPKYTAIALKYLRNSLNRPELADQFDWWVEFEGSPVKWNWPVGLSYDLLTGLDPTKDSETHASHIPWTLILHHKNYPKEHILALQGPATVRDFWMNQIKESSVVRTGTANAIMNLSKEDTTNLWESIDDYERENPARFWKIFDLQFPMRQRYPSELRNDINGSGESSSSDKNTGLSIDSIGIKNIPMKIYLPISSIVLQPRVQPYYEDNGTVLKEPSLGNSISSGSGSLLLSSSTMMKRRLLSAATGGGGRLESGENSGSSNSSSSKSNSSSSSSNNNSNNNNNNNNNNNSSPGKDMETGVIRYKIQTLGTALNAATPQLFPSKRTCIVARPMVHGVEIPMGVALLELLQEALYPDGFLHVSIVMMS
ncbi:uncharacterized protein SAPINGB_P001506 [Magnusiomyces paraingens]|uniref:Autophagy protein 5 n=1 Tax=Magnusiomyces paraingens TaxID=2606893 RepID=A0A5E8B6B0_9ASCO|nr:uncharacterized protein SAPINGB_P001506 [Saprochaete ingens]VVT47025.1 unnamed protein product [Saprochaete ingens]